MATAQDVLYLAARYLGIKESPPGSNKTMFGEWYGVNGVHWCAIFVSYCFYRAKMTFLYEVEPQNKKGFAYCPYGVKYFKEHNNLDQNPLVGDIVFFDWENDGESNHVGILKEIINDNEFICIEGNTSSTDNSNGGEVMKQRRWKQNIVGFVHPPYDGQSLNLNLNGPDWPGYYITLVSPLQTGPDIKQWQQRMIDLGYDLGVDGADGEFGPKSHAALLKFQQDKGLEVDGVIGSITWDQTWV